MFLINPYRFGAAVDADAQAYITLVETADGQALEAGVKSAINAFVVALKAGNLWANAAQLLLPCGARTLIGALVPLKGTAPTNGSGSPGSTQFTSGNYNRKSGLGDASNTSKYLNSNVATSVVAGSSHAYFAYGSISAYSSAADYILLGSFDGANAATLTVLDEMQGTNGRGFRDASYSGVYISAATAATCIIGSRTASNATSLYVDDATASSSASNPSVTSSARNLFYFAANINGAAMYYSRPILQAAGIFSAGLNATQAAALRSAVAAYVSALAAAIGMDGDALAYIEAVETADGQALEAGVKSAIDAFVVGCKADGIWTAIKASCILAGARTLAGALVPLVGTAPTNNNFVSGDYNRKTGLVSNGTKYLNSNRNAQADPQDSYHLSVYASAVTSNNSDYAGHYNLPANGSLLQRANNLHYGYARSSIAVGGNNVSAGFIGTRRSSSTSIQLRSGGVTSTATASPSTVPPNQLTPIFARTDVLPATGYARLAFYSIGESLDLALLDARVSALISAYSAAIP